MAAGALNTLPLQTIAPGIYLAECVRFTVLVSGVLRLHPAFKNADERIRELAQDGEQHN